MEKMGELALFPELTSGVVPLWFSIHVKHRDQIKQVLFDHQIYSPVHWPIEDIISEKFRESHKLSAEIMILICDQRYDSKDMKRIARIVRENII